MVISLLIAKFYHKDYLAFIDDDNYVPGAVNEYVKIFAAAFGMSNTRYCNRGV
jgi:mannosyl-3-phosphoglycerate synthase